MTSGRARIATAITASVSARAGGAAGSRSEMSIVMRIVGRPSMTIVQWPRRSSPCRRGSAVHRIDSNSSGPAAVVAVQRHSVAATWPAAMLPAAIVIASGASVRRWSATIPTTWLPSSAAVKCSTSENSEPYNVASGPTRISFTAGSLPKPISPKTKSGDAIAEASTVSNTETRSRSWHIAVAASAMRSTTSPGLMPTPASVTPPATAASCSRAA